MGEGHGGLIDQSLSKLSLRLIGKTHTRRLLRDFESTGARPASCPSECSGKGKAIEAVLDIPGAASLEVP